MRRYIIAFVMLCATIVPLPVINPDNVQPSGWFTPTAQKN